MVSDSSVHRLTNIVRWLEDLSRVVPTTSPSFQKPGEQAGRGEKEGKCWTGRGGKTAKEGDEERVAKRKYGVCVCVVNCSQGPNQLRCSQIEMDGLTIDGWTDESR